MQDEGVVFEQKKNSIVNEAENADGSASLSIHENVNYVCTEDEIGVTLDYQPSNLESIYNDNRSSSSSRTAHNSRQRRRTRRSHRERVRTGCTNTWILPFVSGMFTGLIFLIIGIVFVIYFRQLPNYIGILFILVSIPPFCMAINKYRTYRQREQMRRRVELRRQVMREMRTDENDEFRNGSLPFSDMPPSYTNLAFEHFPNESRVTNDIGVQRNSSTVSETALPSYKDAVKTYKENKRMRHQSSDESDLDAPKYEEVNDVVCERLHTLPQSSLTSVSTIHPSMPSPDPSISPPGQISSSPGSVHHNED